MTTNQQLELGFDSHRSRTAAPRPSPRASRAAWWFAQMRQAVDSAFDWQPAPAARAEQILMPGERREIQICE